MGGKYTAEIHCVVLGIAPLRDRPPGRPSVDCLAGSRLVKADRLTQCLDWRRCPSLVGPASKRTMGSGVAQPLEKQGIAFMNFCPVVKKKNTPKCHRSAAVYATSSQSSSSTCRHLEDSKAGCGPEDVMWSPR